MRRVLAKLSIAVFLLCCIVSCSKDDSNGSNSPTTLLTANDFNLVLDENPANDFLLGTLNGYASQGSVNFSLTNEHPVGALEVDLPTGKLRVKDSSLFNYEVDPMIQSDYRISDGNTIQTAKITIQLRDIYERYSHFGIIHLESQEEVDAFGEENPFGVDGLLWVEGETITDLSPLSTLKIIGSLYVINTQATLEGLSNLRIIEGNLTIKENAVLTELTGLNNLDSVGRDLSIRINPNLETVVGLNNLKYVGRYLDIYKNQELHSLYALSHNLTVVGNNIHIGYNHSLRYLTGLESIEELSQSFNIHHNAQLRNLDALENLSFIGNELRIASNPHLSDFCGITPLLFSQGVMEEIIIEDNFFNPTPEQIAHGDCTY